MHHEILTTINGEATPLDVRSNDVLLDVLRTRVGVKSPKIGLRARRLRKLHGPARRKDGSQLPRPRRRG